jgi:DNA-binding NtrC family response regulator
MLAARGAPLAASHFPGLAPAPLAVEAAAGASLPFFAALEEFERGYLCAVLRQAEGNLTRAAELAQLSRSSLREKALHYDLLPGNRAPPGAARSRARRLGGAG